MKFMFIADNSSVMQKYFYLHSRFKFFAKGNKNVKHIHKFSSTNYTNAAVAFLSSFLDSTQTQPSSVLFFCCVIFT